jgi:UDPglucose 6-dehydrogenase
VPPFTTDNLQRNSKHLLLFNPEFLKARSAYVDFRNPTFQLIGYTPRSETVAQAILGILPLARFMRIMPAAAAEMFKYVRNSFLGVKNSFYNQIFDLCQAVGVDYSQIKECAEIDPWIGREHLDVMMDGYRGFNGMCLPKDTEAFLIWAKEKGVDLTILKQAIEFNSELLASQNIKKES